MADCLTEQGRKDTADEFAEALIGAAHIGLDSQLTYFHQEGQMEAFAQIADHFKDAYKNLKDLNLRPQERNALWTDKQVDEFDIAEHIKKLNDGQQRREKIRQYEEDRAKDLREIGVRSAPIFDGANLTEGANTRPALRYANPDLVPPQPESVKSEQYPWADGHQLYGVNMIVNAVKSGKPAAMLADSPGVGKTGQILIAANEIANLPKYKDKKLGQGGGVLIVVPNEQIIDSRFKADAQAINKTALHQITTEGGKIAFSTYSSLDKLSGNHYAAVLYDESHLLANEDTNRRGAFDSIKSDFTGFASGTPYESPMAGSFFISKMLGKPMAEVEEMLDFHTEKEEYVQNGEKKEKTVMYVDSKWLTDPKDKKSKINELGFFKQYYEKVSGLTTDFTKEGTLVNRMYPLYGKSFNVTVDSTIGQVDSIGFSMIEDYFRKKEENLRFATKNIKPEAARDAAMRQGLMAIGKMRKQAIEKYSESMKFNYIFGDIKRQLAAGKSVVVSYDYVADELGIEGLGGRFKVQKGNPHVTMIETLRKKLFDALTKEGIKFVELKGGNDKKKMEAIKAFQDGNVDVMLMTQKTGGTGIDLDDQLGTRPRKLIAATTGYSARDMMQLIGRVSRRNSQSPSEVEFVKFNGSKTDRRMDAIVERKKQIVGASMKGNDMMFGDGKATDVYDMVKFYAKEKDGLISKGIKSEQDLYDQFKKYQRAEPEANVSEFLELMKEC